MTEVQKRVHVLMGEAQMRLGRIDAAREKFAAAGVGLPNAIDSVLEHRGIGTGVIADTYRLLEQGRIVTACAMFRHLGSSEGLIDCGNYALRKGWPGTACYAFEIAAGLELEQATA
jgi:hypothetical protein